MAVDTDPALQALLLPFADGALAWPARDGALFVRAREGAVLHRQPLPGLVCATDWKPDADALARAGWPVQADRSTQATFPLVLLLPPRQREHARAVFARAIDAVAAGGIVVAAMANDEGARSGEKDFARLAGPLQSLSKHRCRVFWSGPLHGPADPALAAQWRDADAPRPIAGGRFLSGPGVFAWDRIDPASALLLAHLPGGLAGDGADLGCGVGVLAKALLENCRGISTLDLYEADARALALARRNLAGEASAVPIGFHWHDVAGGLPRQYDFIVSNPPFHAQRREDRPDLGRAFIAAAANALRDDGRLLLVANRHLPYEIELSTRFEHVRTLAQREGFKVVEALKREDVAMKRVKT